MEADIHWSLLACVVCDIVGFSGDSMLGVDPACHGGQVCAQDIEGVSEGILEASFAEFLALEQVVSLSVQWSLVASGAQSALQC